MQAEVSQTKAKMGARDAEAQELEGDITIAVRDVQEALNRETQALSQAEEEREVGALPSPLCLLHLQIYRSAAAAAAAHHSG